jgi:MoxR-like ATPase
MGSARWEPGVQSFRNRVPGEGDRIVAVIWEEPYESLTELRERAKAEIAKVVIGQDRAVELLLVAALARGHVLIEGPPGSAKTLLGRATAHMLGATFKRVQFTPDTTPAELTGTNAIRMGEKVFLPGVVFTNVLLADEINRTPPRTQAALLEAMQERQVTVEGKGHRLPDPFLVIATQNPYEHRDVFELPESQLDRFLFKIELNYSDSDSEYEMLDLPHKGVAPDMLGEVRPLLGVVGLDKARVELDATELPEEVGRYMVALARMTRELEGVELGVSSRGIIHLASAARANARLSGRDVVTGQDVREVAPYVLRHRIITEKGITPDDILRLALEQVPAPAQVAKPVATYTYV